MSKKEKALDIAAYQKAQLLKDISRDSPDVPIFVRIGDTELEIKDRVKFVSLIDSEMWLLAKKAGWVSVDE